MDEKENYPSCQEMMDKHLKMIREFIQNENTNGNTTDECRRRIDLLKSQLWFTLFEFEDSRFNGILRFCGTIEVLGKNFKLLQDMYHSLSPVEQNNIKIPFSILDKFMMTEREKAIFPGVKREKANTPSLNP